MANGARNSGKDPPQGYPNLSLRGRSAFSEAVSFFPLRNATANSSFRLRSNLNIRFLGHPGQAPEKPEILLGCSPYPEIPPEGL